MTTSCTWMDVAGEAAQRLAAAGIDNARRDAQLLLADALGTDRAGLISIERDPVTWEGLTAFESRVARRAAGEPVSRIRGWREFHGHRFTVTPDVLDPRPETELLVDEGIARLPAHGRVADLGTGSGCILISVLAARSDASGCGVDISDAALDVAARNAANIGVADRAQFFIGAWDALDQASAAGFDLVVSNPPYVTDTEFAGLDRDVRDFDPRLALVGGEDGLDPYRIIAPSAARILKPGGWLGVEFGRGQEAQVCVLLEDAGFTAIVQLRDMAGIVRAAFGRRPPAP